MARYREESKLCAVHKTILETRGVPKVQYDEQGREYLIYPDGTKQYQNIYRTLQTYREHGLLADNKRGNRSFL